MSLRILTFPRQEYNNVSDTNQHKIILLAQSRATLASQLDVQLMHWGMGL